VNTPLRRSGIARVLKGCRFYLHTPHSSVNGMNHTYFCLSSRSYRPRRDGRLSWPWVASWLHTEMSVDLQRRRTNPFRTDLGIARQRCKHDRDIRRRQLCAPETRSTDSSRLCCITHTAKGLSDDKCCYKRYTRGGHVNLYTV